MKMDSVKVNSSSVGDILPNVVRKNIDGSTSKMDKDVSGIINKFEKTLEKFPSDCEKKGNFISIESGILNESQCLEDKNLKEKSLSSNIFDVTKMVCPVIGSVTNTQLYTTINGINVRKSFLEIHKNIVDKEMERIRKILQDMKMDRRVSLRYLIEINFKNNKKNSVLYSIVNEKDDSIIEEFKKYYKCSFNIAVRVPGNDIFISLVPDGGRKCNCVNCLEGCSIKNCLMNKEITNFSITSTKVPSVGEELSSQLDKDIENELEFFTSEIEQRGDSNVAFIDVCNQYLIDKGVTSTLYMLFYNGTQKEYSYCVEVLTRKFNLSWKDCDGLTLSMKDLDFGEENTISKPCSLAHEKEIEDGLEAVIAGGDILCEDEVDYYSCNEVSDNNGSFSNGTTTTEEDEKSMTITEMLINKAGFENGDALEQFICSRIEYYIAENGCDRIPINEMDSIVNSFFEMHVDPIREFGKGWPEMCQKWVDKKYLYFSKDKTAIMVTDPETPELYLKDNDKIFTNNQEENERIIDELEKYGINLRPYVLFRNGQPHIIIEDASVENNGK
ncbi:Hypothetical protein SRAE_1000330300 [Strongyloides ratti]|uniref:Uncharacterized protein n=1 Tax=Strongyloides ratti TaxID=34506 RepID=A0A090LBY3_STRRB|nr:Hypothetical protein SRAE_1000330300 [Strongyloides ratti]CEF65050.1 Hypothetical protein SRAE_1000330300 [Strongyloides ratti]